MTQQEFQERVKVTVCAEEYDAIETVYLMSDLNKDDFCKIWVQMNRSRVEREAKKAKAEKEIAALKERAHNIYRKLETFINKGSDNYFCDARLFLGTRDQKFIEDKLDILLGWQGCGQLMFKLGKYIGIY